MTTLRNVVRAPLPTSDPIVDLLRALLAEVKALRADLAQRSTAKVFREGTLISDARLLTTIAASVQGHPFSAGELLAHAAVDADLAHALQGITSARQLGKRLQ